MFWLNTQSLLAEVNIDLENISVDSLKELDQFMKTDLLNTLKIMPRLKLLTVPEIWWKRRLYVEEKDWSNTLVKFIAMNAGLSNRNH